MINEWKLHTANIVIPILSSITNHKTFKNQKMIETLRNGIKNVEERSFAALAIVQGDFRRPMLRKFGSLQMELTSVFLN